MWAQIEHVPMLQGWNVLVPESFSRLLGNDPRRAGYEFGLAQDPALFGSESHVPDLLRARVVAVDRAVRRSWTLDAPRWRPSGGSERWRYYVNERTRPVAWLVHRVRTVPDDEALRIVRGEGGPFDPASEALAREPIAVAGGDAGGTVHVVGYDADEIRLRASAPGAALLVTSELAYPGWRGEVDGRDVRVHTVNAGFRAVELPAGEHDVVFRYRPTPGGLGLLVGGLAAAIVVACALPRRRAALP
jgi:hypothetical protein